MQKTMQYVFDLTIVSCNCRKKENNTILRFIILMVQKFKSISSMASKPIINRWNRTDSQTY